MTLGAIVMPIEKKFGLLVVLVVALFFGLQYLSWVSIVAFHWGFAVATGVLLLIALIFIMLFGCFEVYCLEQERVEHEIIEEIRADNPINDD
ncbi:hypothetical protein PanWU01x14_209320 [Parasponia andersonii]|uniref:Transmembrane protein n=1 Tax=Parasponia andersonii TaxID=3476 RepID=A0A2P5BUR5_PARAD|nr:hypothetical protein PanWU01x14_209320 [Parasponia andersonii]